MLVRSAIYSVMLCRCTKVDANTTYGVDVCSGGAQSNEEVHVGCSVPHRLAARNTEPKESKHLQYTHTHTQHHHTAH